MAPDSNVMRDPSGAILLHSTYLSQDRCLDPFLFGDTYCKAKRETDASVLWEKRRASCLVSEP